MGEAWGGGSWGGREKWLKPEPSFRRTLFLPFDDAWLTIVGERVCIRPVGEEEEEEEERVETYYESSFCVGGRQGGRDR